jgi:hypothetical protein
MKHIIIVLGIILSAVFLEGCDEDTFVEPRRVGSVRGQVLLNTNRQPVAKTLVRLSPSGRITESDSSGNFRFDSVLAGKYTVQVTKEGFRSEVVTVEADQALVSVLTVLLNNDRTQNRPPTAASQPTPTSGATGVSVSPILRWESHRSHPRHAHLRRVAVSRRHHHAHAIVHRPETGYTRGQ